MAVDTTMSEPGVVSRRWGTIWLMFFAAAINFVDRGSLSVAMPQIAAEMNFSPEVQGVLLASFFWTYAATQIPMGWAVDRFDPKWIYAIAFALWSVACGLTGLAGGIVGIAAARMVLGIGESAYYATSTKMVSRLFSPVERGFPSGFVECGTTFGLAAGSVITAYLSQKYGWRIMFGVIGLSGLLWLAPWLRYAPGKRTGDGGSPELMRIPRKRWITINRNLVGICIGSFCYNYRWYLVMTWLPTYLVKERGMSLLGAGVLAAIPYWAYALLKPSGGYLGDTLIRRGWDASRVRKGLVAAGCLCGLSVLPIPLVSNVETVTALLFVNALTGIAVANFMVIQQASAPLDELGRWAGVMGCVGNLAGTVAPLVTGWLVSRTGSYLIPFALGALMMIPCIIAFVFIVGRVAPPKPGVEDSTPGAPKGS